MLIAESLAQGEIFILGVLGVGLAAGLWWRTRLVRSIRIDAGHRASAGDPSEGPSTDRVADQINRFELRLYDYCGEVEGRMQTRLAKLDRLVIEADREITRLQELLEQNNETDPNRRPDIIVGDKQQTTTSAEGNETETSPPLSPWQRRMVLHLSDAGYSAPEIGVLIDRPQEEVEAAIAFERAQRPRGAA